MFSWAALGVSAMSDWTALWVPLIGAAGSAAAYLRIESDDRKEMKLADERVAEATRKLDKCRVALAQAQASATPDPAVEADRALYAKFQKDMPMGLIVFFRDHHFAGSFPIRTHTALDQFQLLWGNADHTFISPNLDARRKRLAELSNTLAWDIANNTWHHPNGVNQGVPPEWEHEQPERHEEVTERLNKMSVVFAQEAEAFIVEAKRELRV